MQLAILAETIGCPFKGPGEIEILGFKDVELLASAPIPGMLYYVESKKYLSRHPQVSQATAVLTIQELADHFPTAVICNAKEARLKFIATLKLFEFKYSPAEKRSTLSYIHPTAKVADSAIIYPGAVILEGAEVGESSEIHSGVVLEPFVKVGHHTVIHPNVVIGHHCVVGDHCRIFSATVIGADGFGFYDHGAEERYKIPQIGNVEIGHHVEIGAGCTIDRATIESTRIGDHTKLDNQVHIGHNCQVGRYVYMAGAAVLAGSVKVGDYAIIAGQATIAQGVTIHPKAVLLGMSATQRDMPSGEVWLGAVQAMPVKQMHRVTSLLMHLPELAERVATLEKKLTQLEEKTN